MEISPYTNMITSRGETLVMVPVNDLRQLEQAEKVVKSKQFKPCLHPEEKLQGLEILPDLVFCPECGAMLKVNEHPQPYTIATIHDLEAQFYDYLKDAITEIDDAYTCLNSNPVLRLVNQIQSTKKTNPVLMDRERRRKTLLP